MLNEKRRWEIAVGVLTDLAEIIAKDGSRPVSNGSPAHQAIRQVVELARGGFVGFLEEPNLNEANEILQTVLGNPARRYDGENVTAAAAVVLGDKIDQLSEVLGEILRRDDR